MKIDYKKKKILSQGETDTQELSFMVEDTSLKLQSDILATKRSFAETQQKLKESKMEYPLNVKKVMQLQTEVNNLQDGLVFLTALKEELGL